MQRYDISFVSTSIFNKKNEKVNSCLFHNNGELPSLKRNKTFKKKKEKSLNKYSVLLESFQYLLLTCFKIHIGKCKKI